MTVASWAMLMLLWIGAFALLIYLRNAELRDTEVELNNLTRVMASESEMVFRTAETIMLYMRETIEEGDRLERETIEDFLSSETPRIPFLSTVGVFDANGALRYLATRQNIPQPANGQLDVSTQDWFAATRDADRGAMVVSPPFESRLKPGTWLIPLSLRIEGPDHRFKGAIVATLDPSYFDALFRDLDLGPDGTVALHRSDSVTLARQPLIGPLIGQPRSSGSVYQLMRRQHAGVVHARSAVDGEKRIMGGRMLDSFPVYVAISRTERSVLTVWKTQVIIILAATALISLLLVAVVRQSDTAARLEAKDETVHALVDASPRPLATLRRMADGGLAVERANQQFATLLGLPLSGILDRPLNDVLAEATGSPLPPVVQDPSGSRLRLTLKTDPEPTEAQMLFTPISARFGALDIILVTGVDLTARRVTARREAERHLLEALGRMAGRIAHEINNVFQPILSHCSLALHANTGNAAVEEHLHEIQTGVRSGRDIVRSVLNLAGGRNADRQPRSLAAELTAAVQLIRPAVPDRITLSLTQSAPDARISLAAGEMFQILGNLVGNAVDAIEGPGRISIVVERYAVDLTLSADLDIPPGRYLQIQVSDDGCGMPPEVFRRALDPFFTTKPFGHGAGLGLPTVQSVVSALNGCITLSSTAGIGTTIRILLPEYFD